MYESISKNNELENEMTLDMSYFWYSDALLHPAMPPARLGYHAQSIRSQSSSPSHHHSPPCAEPPG